MKHKVRKVLIIMVLTLPIIFSFGSYGLYSWSLSLDGDMGFLLFYSPLASLHRINGELGLNRFVEEGRQKFSLLRKETFPSAPVQKKLAGSSDARDFSMESAAPLPATLPEEEPVPAEPAFQRGDLGYSRYRRFACQLGGKKTGAHGKRL